MTREQLEHLIRAAAVISGDDTIVVLGSQAIRCRCLTALTLTDDRQLAAELA